MLIPRPETELLVDLALERLPKDAPRLVLDLGTGSGCVAISIASERSRLKILAVDQSVEALIMARRNALECAVGNVAFVQSDWFSGLRRDERFDMTSRIRHRSRRAIRTGNRRFALRARRTDSRRGRA